MAASIGTSCAKRTCAKARRSIRSWSISAGLVLRRSPPGRPGGFSGNRPTDKRQMKDQEAADRDLFVKNRGAFNVKHRQEYERQQKARRPPGKGEDASPSEGQAQAAGPRTT